MPRDADPTSAPAEFASLFGELGDLKRIRSASHEGSIATRFFARSWDALIAGQDARSLAIEVAAAALAAARLGDIDAEVLAAAGIPSEEVVRIRRRAVGDLAAPLATAFRDELVRAVGQASAVGSAACPAFVRLLQQQPRAGVTCPGKPRIVLEPAENHAEHSLLVAVYGVLLSAAYRADPAIVFLAGLSHHLHNSGLPDAGFTGEELLGDALPRVMDHFTTAALAELPPALAADVVRARTILPDADTPEGRAFHAADVIDRVLEIRQHLRAATLTMDEVLGEMALVHAGPVKPFHDRVLAEMGLP